MAHAPAWLGSASLRIYLRMRLCICPATLRKARQGLAWLDMARHGSAWRGLARPRSAWRCMAPHI